MKTSIYKSINLSHNLEFDYSVNLRRYAPNTSKSYWDKYLSNKTENCSEINYSYYNVEKDGCKKGNYHSHYLTKLNNKISLIEFAEITTNIFNDLIGIDAYTKTEGVNRKLLKIQNKSGDYQDKYFDIPFQKLNSKSGMIYIEPVIEKNIIYYNNKYSDWGITDGFIKGKSVDY
jgi:hypothetical protein